MAGFLDPFTPGQDAAPTAGVEPGTFDKIRGEWGAFLSDPRGQAAMMSMGLALTQPPSFGDNAVSQVGRAVGSMGESGRLMEAQDLKRTEAESKDEARQAQSEARMLTAESRSVAAEAKAGMAGARNETSVARLALAERSLELKQQQLTSQTLTAEARLEIQRETLKLQREIAELRRSEGAARTELGQARLEGAGERNRLGNQVRLSQMYQNYVRDVAKRNDPIALSMRPGAVPESVLPINEWIKTNPMLKNSGLIDNDTDEDTFVPPTSNTTSGRSPQDAQALTWANANPADPRAIAIKKRLGVQ